MPDMFLCLKRAWLKHKGWAYQHKPKGKKNKIYTQERKNEDQREIFIWIHSRTWRTPEET